TRVTEWCFNIPFYDTLSFMLNICDKIKYRYFDDKSVLWEDTYIENIRVRIYDPVNATKTPQKNAKALILYFHGGGFFFGSVGSHDTMNYYLSKYSGTKIIAVDYHLSPTVHYPVAVNQSIRVTRYILQHPQKYNIDPTRVFLAGDSAGILV
ncbi:unnamed protein product, partial [Didymodactylos carnosus]